MDVTVVSGSSWSEVVLTFSFSVSGTHLIVYCGLLFGFIDIFFDIHIGSLFNFLIAIFNVFNVFNVFNFNIFDFIWSLMDFVLVIVICGIFWILFLIIGFVIIGFFFNIVGGFKILMLSFTPAMWISSFRLSSSSVSSPSSAVS
jgi:hypothetical protein